MKRWDSLRRFGNPRPSRESWQSMASFGSGMVIRLHGNYFVHFISQFTACLYVLGAQTHWPVVNSASSLILISRLANQVETPSAWFTARSSKQPPSEWLPCTLILTRNATLTTTFFALSVSFVGAAPMNVTNSHDRLP